jgi:hypothetical protein
LDNGVSAEVILQMVSSRATQAPTLDNSHHRHDLNAVGFGLMLSPNVLSCENREVEMNPPMEIAAVTAEVDVRASA